MVYMNFTLVKLIEEIPNMDLVDYSDALIDFSDEGIFYAYNDNTSQCLI